MALVAGRSEVDCICEEVAPVPLALDGDHQHRRRERRCLSMVPHAGILFTVPGFVQKPDERCANEPHRCYSTIRAGAGLSLPSQRPRYGHTAQLSPESIRLHSTVIRFFVHRVGLG